MAIVTNTDLEPKKIKSVTVPQENVHNIVHYERNANQNYSEISPRTDQNDHNQRRTIFFKALFVVVVVHNKELA